MVANATSATLLMLIFMSKCFMILFFLLIDLSAKHAVCNALAPLATKMPPLFVTQLQGNCSANRTSPKQGHTPLVRFRNDTLAEFGPRGAARCLRDQGPLLRLQTSNFQV